MNERTSPAGKSLVRREFLRSVGSAAAAGIGLCHGPSLAAPPTPQSAAETAVKVLYDSLTDDQRAAICFDWNHIDSQRKMKLRHVVTPNWQVTAHKIRSDFYTRQQQHIIHDAFKGLVHPDWLVKFEREIKDDCAGPFGCEHSIAIFGQPGIGPFELVITGRHMTLRADGNSEDQAAFGGPIFYGHQGEAFFEKADHPSNVFWPQALAANKVFTMLDGKQRSRALIDSNRPAENQNTIRHRGQTGRVDGLPAADMSADQKSELRKVLATLIEPFRVEDRDDVFECLGKNGGIENCSLTFYRDGDIGKDEVWDNWKLEGPRFCWWFRGEPHVHVWVNVGG